jgi:hypothetical protein
MATDTRRSDQTQKPRVSVETDGRKVFVVFRSLTVDGLERQSCHSLTRTEAAELSRLLSEATERSGI